MSRPVAVRFSDVSFSYGDIAVLERASFHVHQGEFVSLVGPNGAGKTTVLRLILALARPSQGSVTVLETPPELARESIGYVPQQLSYDAAFPISVREVVRLGRVKRLSRRFTAEDDEAIDQAMELAQVSDLGSRPYPALSGGQRRRVLVARALAARPKLLILDEPTANMDVMSEERLFQALGAIKGSTTVLIVTHDSGFVSALTDEVFCVGERGSKGSIVRHQSRPSTHASPELYGGLALEVLHDTELSDTSCCSPGGDHE